MVERPCLEILQRSEVLEHIQIVNGMEEGNITRALAGEHVGTRIFRSDFPGRGSPIRLRKPATPSEDEREIVARSPAFPVTPREGIPECRGRVRHLV